ncbi:receptor-type tyrosine-protein phosphatase C-like [Culicoides brevitarsis]|uniref:receptor-type tyrosine-protein phosphatase C-like n=1 Tax=Culicoides brevitarsis TaxID=469753 RepID=UPI00307C7362
MFSFRLFKIFDDFYDKRSLSINSLQRVGWMPTVIERRESLAMISLARGRSILLPTVTMMCSSPVFQERSPVISINEVKISSKQIVLKLNSNCSYLKGWKFNATLKEGEEIIKIKKVLKTMNFKKLKANTEYFITLMGFENKTAYDWKNDDDMQFQDFFSYQFKTLPDPEIETQRNNESLEIHQNDTILKVIKLKPCQAYDSDGILTTRLTACPCSEIKKLEITFERNDTTLTVDLKWNNLKKSEENVLCNLKNYEITIGKKKYSNISENFFKIPYCEIFEDEKVKVEGRSFEDILLSSGEIDIPFLKIDKFKSFSVEYEKEESKKELKAHLKWEVEQNFTACNYSFEIEDDENVSRSLDVDLKLSRCETRNKTFNLYYGEIFAEKQVVELETPVDEIELTGDFGTIKLCEFPSHHLKYELTVEWMSFSDENSTCQDKLPTEDEKRKIYNSNETEVKLEKLVYGSNYNFSLNVYDEKLKQIVASFNVFNTTKAQEPNLNFEDIFVEESSLVYRISDEVVKNNMDMIQNACVELIHPEINSTKIVTHELWNPFRTGSPRRERFIDLNSFYSNEKEWTLSLKLQNSLAEKVYTQKCFKRVSLALFLIPSLMFVALAISIMIYCSQKKQKKKRLIFDIMESISPNMDIPVKDFVPFIQNLPDKSHIIMEYQSIDTTPIDQSCIIGQENKSKNRYKNILPFDHNVLEVSDIPDLEYINASMIQGYDGEEQFIATQGPTEETCIDFWNMIIGKNIEAIVMLTSFQEGNRVKCARYFPECDEDLSVGDILVSCDGYGLEPTYERRLFTVKKGDRMLKVHHYKFLKWLDHNVPSNPEYLVDFVKFIREQGYQFPLVVHCSAGVGRTGTFIALWILIDRINIEHRINVREVVGKLRTQRVQMVQTFVQYEYLYRCLMLIAYEQTKFSLVKKIKKLCKK